MCRTSKRQRPPGTGSVITLNLGVDALVDCMNRGDSPGDFAVVEAVPAEERLDAGVPADEPRPLVPIGVATGCLANGLRALLGVVEHELEAADGGVRDF